MKDILKPKKGFVMAQLDIEKLSPNQWDGIMMAMDNYAEHYHNYKQSVEHVKNNPMYSKCCGSKLIPFNTYGYNECPTCGKTYRQQY